MGFSPQPRMFLSYHISTMSRITRKIFLPNPYPLGFHEASPHLVKLYFLLISPTTITLFLKKLHVSLIKIYFKLQINLSHQIKLFFSKNRIILPKYLTRKYHNKNKNLIE